LDQKLLLLLWLKVVVEHFLHQEDKKWKTHLWIGNGSRKRARIPTDLNDRAADIWEPLLALAELAGGDWPERARTAAVGLTSGAQEESAIGALLFDILICFLSGNAERVFRRTLVEKSNEMGERPYAELGRGRQVTEVWLARQLGPYGVRPKTMWIGERAAKVHLEEDLKEAFARYIPKSQARAMLDELKVVSESAECGVPPSPRLQRTGRNAECGMGKTETAGEDSPGNPGIWAVASW
jgi:hypothetical protein